MPVNSLIPLSFRPTTDLMGPRDIISLQDFAQRARLQQQEQQEKVQIQAALSQPGGVDPNGAPSLKAIGEITKVKPQLGLQIAQMRETMTLRDLQINEKKRTAGLRIEQAYVEAFDRHLQTTGGNRQEAVRLAQADRMAAIDEFEKSGAAAQMGFGEQELNRARQAMRDPDQTRAILTAQGGEVAKPQQPTSDLGKLKADLDAGRISQKDYDAAVGKKTAPTMQQQIQNIEISPEDKKYWADVIRKGGTLPPGLARSAAGAKLVAEIMKEVPKSGTPTDMLAKQAEFTAFKAGLRTLAQRQANVDMPVQEAINLAPLALKASEEMERTNVKSVNDLYLAAKGKTASPELRRLSGATNALINVYARAVSPTGAPTMSDKDHAREVLDRGFSKGDYEAAVDQLMKEMHAAQKSPEEVMRRMTKQFSGEKEVERATSKSGRPMHKNAEGKWEYD